MILGPLQTAAPPVPAPELSPAGYTFLQKLIYRESGIALGSGKQYLFSARLTPLIRQESVSSLDALARLLATNPSLRLQRLVVEAMTTHETLFFRDPVMFEALRKEVLPELFRKVSGSRKLRFWSAAASSGQEAYSLAILLLESGMGPAEVEIVGTDLSTQVLDRAREGTYNQFEVDRGLCTVRLAKYFDKCESGWRLKEQVRGMVRFEQRDLRSDLTTLGRFDLILCRNVLIYFDSTTVTSICTALRSRLLPDSLLALGCGEVLPASVGLRWKVVNQSTFFTSEER